MAGRLIRTMFGVLGLWVGFATTAAVAQTIDFKRDIEPFFKSRCLGCHGPQKQESGFRLDRRAVLLKGGDYSEPSIVPGDPSKGTLLKAVKGADADFRMPPKGPLLSKTQVSLIERWIKEGAVWPGQMGTEVQRERSTHWAFQPVVRPPVPVIGSPTGSKIDAFLQHSLKEAGISSSPPADSRTLIRRVSIIWTALPPTPETVIPFQAAYRQHPQNA